MASQVVLYRLHKKVVNSQTDVPDDARQVMYYSLAIGHHVGVMDCFAELLAVPVENYKTCLYRLPNGEARRKLEGVLQWQEIEINRSHAETLLPQLEALSSDAQAQDADWIRVLARCLREMIAEPALYLMIRMRT